MKRKSLYPLKKQRLVLLKEVEAKQSSNMHTNSHTNARMNRSSVVLQEQKAGVMWLVRGTFHLNEWDNWENWCMMMMCQYWDIKKPFCCCQTLAFSEQWFKRFWGSKSNDMWYVLMISLTRSLDLWHLLHNTVTSGLALFAMEPEWITSKNSGKKKGNAKSWKCLTWCK